jgi:hypothetical protein
MAVRNALAAAFTLIALLGCATVDPARFEPHAYAGPSKPLNEVATLLGATDIPPLRAVFRSVDGMQVTNGGAGVPKAYVLPGTRLIEVFGHTDGGAGLPPTQFRASFAAGHTYKLRYRLSRDEALRKDVAHFWFEDLGGR